MPGVVFRDADGEAAMLLFSRLPSSSPLHLAVHYSRRRVSVCVASLPRILRAVPARHTALRALFLPVAPTLDATVDWWLLNALLVLHDDLRPPPCLLPPLLLRRTKRWRDDATMRREAAADALRRVLPPGASRVRVDAGGRARPALRRA